MLELFSKPETWLTLLTLTGMEIVLGIDNIIFISIVTGKLPKADQSKARSIGLFLALFIRIALLTGISYLAGMTNPLFSIMEHGFSGRDLIMLGGGLFLVVKTTSEIYNKLESAEEQQTGRKRKNFGAIVMQVILIDIIFSFDSIITAVGLAQDLEVMIGAVILSMVIMMVASKAVSDFIHRHPSMKMLALSFLMMIGALLVAEGFGQHVEKTYVYFAMAFSLVVESLNIWTRKKSKPVKLHDNNPPEL